MKAKTFDEQFDGDVDLTASLDLPKAQRVLQAQQPVNVDFSNQEVTDFIEDAKPANLE
jgi:hypothetical protein